MSDLIFSIAPEELKHIKGCTTSKEVWDKLKTTYESQGPAKKAMLLKWLIQRKMEDGEDMRTHLADFFDIRKLEDIKLNIDKLISILLLYSIPPIATSCSEWQLRQKKKFSIQRPSR